jgi:preprotein translocase subunit YajC
MKIWAFVITHMMSLQMALAETAPAPAAPTASQGIAPFIPLVLMFAVFYFLVIRPQQKKQKDQQKFLSELKRGDMVVTSSGIIGTIRTVSDKFVTLEVDNGVCVKMLRAQILESANNLKEEKESTRKEVTT